MKIKLPSLEGAVITIKSDQTEAKKCYDNSLKTKRGVFSVTTRPPREDRVTREEIIQENRPEPAGGMVEKEIGGKMFKLGQSLSKESQDQVVEVIARHLDAFAWSAADMPGIDPDFLYGPQRLACPPKKTEVQQREASGHTGRNGEAVEGWPHQGNPVPRMASQRGTSKESKWEVEDVCGLHGSQ